MQPNPLTNKSMQFGLQSNFEFPILDHSSQPWMGGFPGMDSAQVSNNLGVPETGFNLPGTVDNGMARLTPTLHQPLPFGQGFPLLQQPPTPNS